MMDEVIKRLEAAEIGSRKLDAQICVVADRLRAIRWYWTGATGIPHAVPGNFDLLKGGMGTASVEAMCPAYTTSMDAARALLPEQCDWWIQTYSISLGKSEAQVLFDRHEERARMTWTNETKGFASTPEIALCIAALRSLQSGASS